MKTKTLAPSTCRHCRNYKSEGRRGGICQLFRAPVRSHWKSCSLASLPFVYQWEPLDGAMPESPVPADRPNRRSSPPQPHSQNF
ncbi:hypothetical protein [Lyngbya sp. CCY1209]|uniref:hypothetical protein n=1 Tax=Lyngbya sp. CCY1209 TaxID=2886103 RepID=UPI002D21139D|nr:hypothetical protein [Lyngbya sp. CCY1209]MEB3885789.1 hypothetical protein [Lyngbya sp. CCY1209]